MEDFNKKIDYRRITTCENFKKYNLGVSKSVIQDRYRTKKS